MTPFDLRGVACPLNFARTRLKLERLALGEALEVWLDAGEPIQLVPPSLEAAGHRIRSLTPQAAGFYVLVVERGGSSP